MLATNKWTEKRMNNQQLPANATELKLSFDDHIDKLCNKLCQRIPMLRRICVYGPLAPLRSAHIILDADRWANSVELFIELNWLPLHLEVKVNICIQVKKPINGHSPSYINDLKWNQIWTW